MQKDRSGDHVEPRQPVDWAFKDQPSGRGLLGFDVVDIVGGAEIGIGTVDAHIVGEVSLQVAVDHEHVVAELRKDPADIKAEHCLADAALQGSEGDDLAHNVPPVR